jgi:probable rRNA maturation factor
MDQSRVNIVFHHEYRSLPLPRRRLRGLARRIARGERIEASGAVNVVFCSDYTIRKLNREYRGKDRVTDVLAFEFHDPDLLGEIYISLHRAAVQARRFGLSYEQEVERLFVHGLFHLLGYTHDTAVTRRAMEQREARYCCMGERG